MTTMSLLQEGESQGGIERDLSGTKIESGHKTTSPRILALPQAKTAGVILDLDDTLYQNVAYRKDVAHREVAEIGIVLDWQADETQSRLAHHRSSLGERLGRPARLTETVIDLGLTREWWNQTRNDVYRPESFLTENPAVGTLLTQLLLRTRVAVATNSPTNVAYRILNLLGVNPTTIDKLKIVGPDTLGVSKPDTDFFVRVAEKLGVPPEKCFSIGDDEQNDAHPAIEAGMGAAIVSNVDDIQTITTSILHEREYEEFDLETFARDLYIPGQVTILGLTGRAGAGKTTTAKQVVDLYERLGIPAAPLGLDAFFKLSSKDRKAWLEEGKQLGEEEYWRRADQMQWWDFEKTYKTLEDLRARKPVHLTNIYNRADKGELTGEIKIEPDHRGMVVVFEGVAAAHLKKDGDHFVYVNAHPRVRKERLLGRDLHRAGDVAYERFLITQSFENDYFPRHLNNMDTIIENSNGTPLKVSTAPHL